jgi:proteic killer suppression protein
VIRGFKNRASKRLWMGDDVRQYSGFAKSALRKLDALNAARTLLDLRAVPGNRLEGLKGERKGQYSIRINEQWRICFVWTTDGPDEVEIVDYH